VEKKDLGEREVGRMLMTRKNTSRKELLLDCSTTIRNRLATEPVMLKVYNIKLSFNIWLVLSMYFILYS